jgi:hypothetical protein
MSDTHAVYVCTECDWACSAEPSGAIGTAHAHAQKHVSRFGLPSWLMLPGAAPEQLDQYIARGTVVVDE